MARKVKRLVNWWEGASCPTCGWTTFAKDVPAAATRHVRRTGHLVDAQPLFQWVLR